MDDLKRRIEKLKKELNEQSNVLRRFIISASETTVKNELEKELQDKN